VTSTNDDYLREIHQSKVDGVLTDGMLDLMEEFVNTEVDRREASGFVHLPEHRQELVDDTIAMFEAGLLEMQVLDFEYEAEQAKKWFASKAACAFANVAGKRTWGR